MNTKRMQVHNGYDTKFKVQGAMKVDFPDPMEEARKGRDLLREADALRPSLDHDGSTAEQQQLYAAQITALSSLAAAHFAAASFYWEDR